jgi:hypothetical protein
MADCISLNASKISSPTPNIGNIYERITCLQRETWGAPTSFLETRLATQTPYLRAIASRDLRRKGTAILFSQKGKKTGSRKSMTTGQRPGQQGTCVIHTDLWCQPLKTSCCLSIWDLSNISCLSTLENRIFPKLCSTCGGGVTFKAEYEQCIASFWYFTVFLVRPSETAKLGLCRSVSGGTHR